MPKSLLFEIGFIDLPYTVFPGEMPDVKIRLTSVLEDLRMSYARLRCWISQRRIGVLIEGLCSAQDDQGHEVRGPKAAAAYDYNNVPLPAAKGFANAQGVEVKDLIVREIDGEKFLFAIKANEGLSLESCLGNLLDGILFAMPFKETAWHKKSRFAFPPLYFIGMLDDARLNLQVDGFKASNCIAIWNDGKVFFKQLNHALEYPGVMKDVGLIEDPGERRRNSEAELRSVIPDGFRLKTDLKRLNRILLYSEGKTPFLIRFDEKFLTLPEAVLHRLIVADCGLLACENSKGQLAHMALSLCNSKKVSRTEILQATSDLENKLNRLESIWQTEKQMLADDLLLIAQSPLQQVDFAPPKTSNIIGRCASFICHSWKNEINDEQVQIALSLLDRGERTTIASLMPGTGFSITAEGLRNLDELKTYYDCFNQVGSYFSGRITVPENPIAVVICLALLIVSHAEPFGGLSASPERIISFLRAARKKIDVFSIFRDVFPVIKIQKCEWIRSCAESCLNDEQACLIKEEFLNGNNFDPVAFFEFAHFLEENGCENLELVGTFLRRIQGKVSHFSFNEGVKSFATLTRFSKMIEALLDAEKQGGVDYKKTFAFLIDFRAEIEACLISLPAALDEKNPEHYELIQLLCRLMLLLQKFPFSDSEKGNNRPKN